MRQRRNEDRGAFRTLVATNPVPARLVPELVDELMPATEMLALVRSGPASRSPSPEATRPRSKLLARVAMAAALVLGAFIVAAPTFGVRVPVLDFWSANPGSQPAIHDFAQMSSGSPAGMDPRVIPSQTRKVLTARLTDGDHILWVAPTQAGGYCTLWSPPGVGGCDTLGTVPLSINWAFAQPPSEVRAPEKRVVTRIDGSVNATWANAVDIQFEDGTTIRPDVTWVSKPIDAGFFIVDITSEHRQLGHLPVKVVAYDASRNVVAEDSLRPDATTMPGVLSSQRTVVVKAETTHGLATIYEAPTRYEGRCAWIEFEGQQRVLGPCEPKGYPFDSFGVQTIRTHDAALIAGPVDGRVDAVVVEYANGVSAHIVPRNGFVLYEIPAAHYETGTEATSISAIDANGNEGAGIDIGKAGPCFAPVPEQARTEGC